MYRTDFGLCGRRWGWDVSREQYWNMYIIYSETDHQPRLDAWDSAPGWCTGKTQRDQVEREVPFPLKAASHRGRGPFLAGVEYTQALPAAAGVLEKGLTTASLEKNCPGWYTLHICGICWFLTVSNSSSQCGVTECRTVMRARHQISGAWCQAQNMPSAVWSRLHNRPIAPETGLCRHGIFHSVIMANAVKFIFISSNPNLLQLTLLYFPSISCTITK